MVEKKMTLHYIVLYYNYCNNTPYYNGIIVIVLFNVVLMKNIKLKTLDFLLIKTIS